MRRIAVVLLIALAATTSFPQATARKKSAPKTATRLSGAAGAIEKADIDRTNAVVKGDMDAVDKSTADTYAFTDPNGRITTKKDLMDQLKSGAIKVSSQSISDVQVNMYGNTAVETGKVTSKATREGKDSSGTFRFTRVWVNQGGNWKTVAFQETRIQ